jgi:hypothetical protein
MRKMSPSLFQHPQKLVVNNDMGEYSAFLLPYNREEFYLTRCSSTTSKQKKPLKKRKMCWAVHEGDGTMTLPIWKPSEKSKST